jgi:HEAT repeat protein
MNSFQSDLEILRAQIEQMTVQSKEQKVIFRDRLEQEIDQVQKAGVQSREGLLALIADPKAQTEARVAACDLLNRLIAQSHPYALPKRVSRIDKRRALKPLLAALPSPDIELRKSAIWTIGILGNKRAFKFLLEITLQDENLEVRQLAIYALGMLKDERAVELLQSFIMNRINDKSIRKAAVYVLGHFCVKNADPLFLSLLKDQTEDAEVRAEAAEIAAYTADVTVLPAYIDAIQEDSMELRFWAAFGIVTLSRKGDISAAFEVLDRVTASDDAVLPGWWSVAREVAPALESLWHNRNIVCDLDGNCGCGGDQTYLISPMPEYWDYREQTTQYIDGKAQHIP